MPDLWRLDQRGGAREPAVLLARGRNSNRLDALGQLDESEARERVELYDSRRDPQVAFIGQHLANDDRYTSYQDFDELAADNQGAGRLVAGVAAALGEDYTLLLDI